MAPKLSSDVENALVSPEFMIQRFPNLRLVDARPDWDSEKRNSRVLNKLPVRF